MNMLHFFSKHVGRAVHQAVAQQKLDHIKNARHDDYLKLAPAPIAIVDDGKKLWQLFRSGPKKSGHFDI